MNTDSSLTWRSCCAGCLLEFILHVAGALTGAGVAALLLPSSATAVVWSLLIFPAIFFSGALAWAFVLFSLMGLDVFKNWLFHRGQPRPSLLPENATGKPGAFMFVVMGLLVSTLALVLIRADANAKVTQTAILAYLAMGALFGVTLWLLGRRGVIAPLSPLLQWIIGDSS
jgi:hypothetical protein